MSIKRLYLTAGRPIVFASGWLTPDAARLSAADLEARSTAGLHAEILKHPVTSSRTSIGAELVGRPVAQLLGIRPRSAVLVLTRSRYDAGDRLRETNRFVVDPSCYQFTLSDERHLLAAATLRELAA